MKLYFRYGAVGSAKTLNLLAVAHCYRQQGKKVLLLKPEMDVRFGKRAVRSRAGLIQDADVLLCENTTLDMQQFKGVDCVLVDECQFLPARLIDQFRQIVDLMRVPVICYGLRTDFRTKLFAGSKRLMEMADSIEEIKTTCSFCNRKATVNMKLANGEPTLAGPQVCLGMEETYIPCCTRDFYARLPEASEAPTSNATDAVPAVDVEAAKAPSPLPGMEVSTPSPICKTRSPNDVAADLLGSRLHFDDVDRSTTG